MADPIKQPNGVMFDNFSFEWNKNFAKMRTENFTAAQKFVDETVLRGMKKYTPELSGVLIKSADNGTKIGSGLIQYLSPYARYQYYGKLMVSSKTGSAYASEGEKKVLTDIDLKYSKTNPLAGKMWFERYKKDNLPVIIRGVEQYTGGRIR